MRNNNVLTHMALVLGVLFLLAPIWLIFASSTYPSTYIVRHGLQWIPTGDLSIYWEVLNNPMGFTGVTVKTMLVNSTIMGLGYAVGKIIVSMMAAYALVFFQLKHATMWFGLIFLTLLLPLEVRIIPSYEVVSGLGMMNSYTGLVLPLIASATATFYFRQFYKTIPGELIEAAQLDNAGPFRFFVDILLPLSKTTIAAIFIIMFIVGWNSYLWPIMMTTDESYTTIVMGISNILSELNENTMPRYDYAFATVMMAMLPPILIVVFFQRWFVKGLVDSEK